MQPNIRVVSFNVLGLGFCAMPGPSKQWSYLSTFLDNLLRGQDPDANCMSFIGFQEDVFVLKKGSAWDSHTTTATHSKFERLSFLNKQMNEKGFEMASFSVHDGLSGSSHLEIRDSNQLVALEDERHRSIFTEITKGGRTCTESNQIKLGNSLWLRKGSNLSNVTIESSSITFDTHVEAGRLQLPEYQLVPSRSAAKVTVRNNDDLIFEVSTCHLAGGKFDDRWLLTGEHLTDINTEMLLKFANDGEEGVPAILFGDMNMKHHTFIDGGDYDATIVRMLFGTEHIDQISKLSANYEDHHNYLRRVDLNNRASDYEAQCLAQVGISLENLAKAYEIQNEGIIDRDKVNTLIRRVRKLWRMGEIPSMELILPENSTASCLFGGVIDHIFFRGMQQQSYYVDDKNEEAMVSTGRGGSIFDRIRASDHFPVTAGFYLPSLSSRPNADGADNIGTDDANNISTDNVSIAALFKTKLGRLKDGNGTIDREKLLEVFLKIGMTEIQANELLKVIQPDGTIDVESLRVSISAQ